MELDRVRAIGFGPVRVIRKPHHHNWANTVVDAVIGDAAEPAHLGGSLGGAEAAATHNDDAELKPLDFQAQPLLHVVVLNYVDFERNLSLHQRLCQVGRFGCGEGVEVVFQLLPGLGGGNGVVGEVGVDRAPIGAVQDGRGAHVEEDDGVPGPEVVLYSPLDGEGALLA